MATPQLALLAFLFLEGVSHSGEIHSIVEILPAAEANQAAVADAHFVYAIESKVIAKYDRATGQRVALSTGEASHLNSGAWWEGRIYCAHSNFPHQPEQSEVRVLDPETMKLTVFKDLGGQHGSLTWVVREGETWWCTFAYYGAENSRTNLVKYDADWKELGVWTYPAQVIARLGKMSISGGVWQEGSLLAIDHDAREIYRLRLPAEGGVLDYLETLPAPFPGQGISLEPHTGRMVGIDRKNRMVMSASLVGSVPWLGSCGFT